MGQIVYKVGGFLKHHLLMSAEENKKVSGSTPKQKKSKNGSLQNQIILLIEGKYTVYIPNCAGCLPSKVLDLSGPQTVFDKYCQVEIKGGKNKIRETQQTQSRDRDRECTWRCLLEMAHWRVLRNMRQGSLCKVNWQVFSFFGPPCRMSFFENGGCYCLLRKWFLKAIFNIFNKHTVNND